MNLEMENGSLGRTNGNAFKLRWVNAAFTKSEGEIILFKAT